MKNKILFSLIIIAFSFSVAEASYIVVTASNDVKSNELIVYDENGDLLETISTNGRGGVPPNKVGGGIVKNDNLLAVINHGSQNVSIFKQTDNSFQLSQLIPCHSKPVSVAFGRDHLYILGTTTIESHLLKGESVAMDPDGITKLLKADGSAAQVGYLLDQLIISERSNMIELVDLKNGAVTSSIQPVQLPPPPQNDTPVGLATRGDTAYVTIAHSNLVGLVQDGELKKTVSSGDQKAPCWLAVMGPLLFCSNTPSKTISIYRVSDVDIALAKEIAATIQSGGLPSDIDAKNGILAVLNLGEESGNISQFQVSNSGNLELLNTAMTSQTANGIAIVHY